MEVFILKMSKENRWVLSRAGIFNYWYYDEEYFDFYDGRMLIRGPNASGKSVTMQSFITLLLDGNYHPSRLDSFGSNARKLEDYVLGEQGPGQKNEAIAYLFLEFKRQNVFVSVGMGIRAKRGTSPDTWYFVLTDGRRFGIDIFFYEKIGDQKIPLTKKKFENLIGDGGKVFSSRKDYMEEVNKILFGFENIEDFENLIDLIVRIRTPKLSRDIKPDTVCRMLQESLPALSESDLRSLSDSIENMDKIQTELKNLEIIKDVLEKLKKVYDEYNQLLLAQSIFRVVESSKEYYSLKKELENTQTELEKKSKLKAQIEEKIEDLKKEQESLSFRLENIKESDVFKLQTELSTIEEELKNIESQKTKKISQLNAASQKLEKERQELKALEEDLEKCRKRIKDYIDEGKLLVEFIGFQRFLETLDMYLLQNGSLDILKEELSSFLSQVEIVLKNYEKLSEIKKDLDDLYRNLDRNRTEAQKVEGEIQNLLFQLEDVKNSLKNAISIYFEQNEVFKAQDEQKTVIFQAINSCEKKGDYGRIYSILDDIYNFHYLAISDTIRRLEFEIETLNSQIKAKKEEIEKIKSQKDDEIILSPQQKKVRDRLLQKGVPFIPFYMAVDFKDGVDERKKAIIEDALSSLGILNALIVPEKYKDVLSDLMDDEKEMILISKPAYFSHLLNQFLEVANFDGPIELKQEVAAVIDSIFATEKDDGIYICEDGRFGSGILKGRTTTCENARFIGIENRRRYRQMLISQLEDEIQKISLELEGKKQEKNVQKTLLEKLKEERNSFPSMVDLDTAFEMIEERENHKSKLQKEIEFLEKKIRELLGRENSLKHEISVIATKLSVTATRDNFLKLRQEAQKLERLLFVLEKETEMEKVVSNSATTKKKLILQIEESLQSLSLDLQNLKARWENLDVRRTEIVRRLSSDDAQKLFEEEKRAIQRLNSIPKEIEDFNKSLQETIAKISQLETLIEIKGLHLEKAKEEYSNSLEILKIELGFGFVFREENLEDEKRLLEFAKEKSSFASEFKSKDLNQVLQRLISAHYAAQVQLAEFGANLYLKEDDKTGYARYLWTAKKDGRLLSFYEFLEKIESEIIEKKNLITQQERELFEEVLIKDIGRRISSKIMLAQDWVKRMNALMDGMDLSGALKFRLSWEQKKQELEDELSTAELIGLMSKDLSIATDEDKQKVVRHFRARIERAKRLQDSPDSFRSLYEIMKEILDYRQWFEFRLYYQRGMENKRELTNNAYDKFSGGEKALSIYVPLLAALCAKYQSAASFAPRIIALDEAFAGVDENNIEKMFELIENLEFDYIMNSQILWGDYKTVPGLCIYELISDRSKGCVLKVKYIWNGYKKVLVEI